MIPLTQEQVEALAEGTYVWVVWSGGNGPHKYKVTRRFGVVAADTEPPTKAHPLDYCGEHPLTQVWLSDPGPRSKPARNR